ncbi:hypothetical protein K502DRAFT_156871 [Neoconidiobolus thromboides FSU 785]|nr:hypothetical protein K502DRAFT_156871 [Neoconidiobolus thromboides FSU 785]
MKQWSEQVDEQLSGKIRIKNGRFNVLIHVSLLLIMNYCMFKYALFKTEYFLSSSYLLANIFYSLYFLFLIFNFKSLLISLIIYIQPIVNASIFLKFWSHLLLKPSLYHSTLSVYLPILSWYIFQLVYRNINSIVIWEKNKISKYYTFYQLLFPIVFIPLLKLNTIMLVFSVIMIPLINLALKLWYNFLSFQYKAIFWSDFMSLGYVVILEEANYKLYKIY